MELPPDSSIVGSNFYSVAESSLLAWMTGHATREYGARFPRITNFDAGKPRSAHAHSAGPRGAA